MDVTTGNHVIKFTAAWCGPCRVYGPIFEAVMSNKSNVHAHSVDIDNRTDLVVKYGIQSVPTTVVVQDGNVVESVCGVIPASSLHTLVDKYFSS